MAKNPLEQAIQSAIRMNETLGNMFAEVGNGYVVSAYQNANRALPQALNENDPISATRGVMHELRKSLREDLRSSFQQSTETGLDESARQLKFYGITTDPSQNSTDLSKQADTALKAVMAQVDTQESILQAMILNDIDQTMIIGDEDRQGVLKPSDILVGAAYWIAALAWDSFSWWGKSNQRGFDFQKQAIAALDARTTDCCLKAHAQIVALDSKFKLTGTPRFADYLEWTPFHWYCRTSVVLYLPQFDDGLTQKMRSGADYVLDQRKAGKNPDRHPADAYWN